MEAPSYPDYVDASLRGVRPTLHLRWNPSAYVVAPGGFTANGDPIPPKYAERWELWDTDPEGATYRVMMLREQNGDFRSPGQWLIDLLEQYNPKRYGGDVSRMLAAAEAGSEKARMVEEKDADELFGYVARTWANYMNVVSVPSAGIPN